MAFSRERSLKYLQLDFFKLREYCIEQGFLGRTRRLTPFGAAAKKAPPDIGAGEDVSFRLFGQLLRALFGGLQVSKKRNLAEFIVKLPDEDWVKGEDDGGNIREAFHASLSPTRLPDGLRQYLNLQMYRHNWSSDLKPYLFIGVDGKPNASRYNGRRREDTLLKDGKPVTDFYSAARAAVEWKKLMDARLEAATHSHPRQEETAPDPNAEEDRERDTSSAQAAFDEAARRMLNDAE